MKILSPAGNFESLKMAVFNGADEVYLGINIFTCVILALIVVVFVLQAINRKRQREMQRKKRNKRR